MGVLGEFPIGEISNVILFTFYNLISVYDQGT